MMSEFQLSLLVIGLVVVAGVYLYGHWQQWRYRRSLVLPSHVPPSTQTSSSIPQQEARSVGSNVTTSEDTSDGICGLLNDATDYVVTFLLKSPLTPEALQVLWLRRFDFGKTVHACGLNTGSGLWEKLIPDGVQTYRAFRIGLQLVDRTGSVSELRLIGFRELLHGIASELQIEVRLPSVEEALRRAQELDRFCADVDQMIGINLISTGERKLSGSEVASAAQHHGMSLESDGSFHFVDATGASLISLAASDGTPFQHLTLNQSHADSLTLLLDIPRVSEPVRHFDEMVTLAQALAQTLRMTLADDRRVALNEGSISQIRAQVVATDELMRVGHIVPGSAQALRLFS